MQHKSAFILFIVLPVFCFLPNLSSQTTIAYWNFDAFNSKPIIGNGSLTSIGGVSTDWTKTGIASGLSIASGLLETDLLKSGGGMQTSNYPVQGINSKTAGIQIQVNTTGYKNILFSVDVRQGGSSANKMMLQYTLDGVLWEKAITYSTNDDDTWYLRNYNFSNISGVNNNSNFAVRLVTNFDDDVINSTVYVPVKSTVIYDPTGPIRFDNIRFRGTSINQSENSGTVLCSWNFNNQNLNPEVGSGSLSLIGNITNEWLKTGIIPNQTIDNEGVYDYSGIKSGFSLSTINYPLSTVSNKSAGIQLNVNTLNNSDIQVSCDVRHGGTSANTMIIQYTENGTEWKDAKTITVNAGDSWYTKYFDFKGISGVENNPLFAIRYVTAFSGSTNAYASTRSDKIYAPTGSIRFDNIVVKAKNITGIIENDETNFWYISNKFLNFSKQPITDIRFIDLSGKLIKILNPELRINLSEISKGIYILNFDNSFHKIIISE